MNSVSITGAKHGRNEVGPLCYVFLLSALYSIIGAYLTQPDESGEVRSASLLPFTTAKIRSFPDLRDLDCVCIKCEMVN